MRRIASVFKKKSSKKSEGKQEQLQHDAPATLDRRSQSVPHLLAPSHPAYSSSASSTASADLRTPDDDGQHSGRFPSPPLSDSPAGKKTWIASWVGGRKSSTLRRNTTQDALPELPPAPQQQPKRQTPSPALTTTTTATPRRPAASAPGKSGPSRRSAVSSDQNSEGSTSEEEDSSDEDEDGGRETFLTSAYHRPTPSPSALSPTQPTYPNALPNTPAIANLRALTAQGFLPPFSPPPLLHLPSKPLFPRSSNTSSSLPREESLRSRAHRQRLAHRLRNGPPLSAAEAREIAPFATRKQGTGVSPKRTSFQLDESAVSDVRRIGAYSRGLNRWASRPCIEDRLVEWRLDTEDGLCSSPISGRPGFAVADLEFSDDLELLAGLRPSAIPDDMPEPSTASSASSSVVNLTVTRPPLPERPKSHPSPLRVDHVPQPSSSAPSSSFKPPSPPAPAPRQAVRFAEDADATEFVPLGYALQQKQRRESKAQFLREQQELRAREEERKRHEEERRKMEAERAQWAAERSAREEERRRHEEEKRQRKIAEDYVRARERQSTQRAGFVPGHSSSASRDRVDEFGQQQPQRRHERQGSSGSIQQQPQLPSNLRHLSEPIAPSVSGRDASPRRAHFPQQPQLSQQSSFAGSSEDLRARSMSGGSQRGGDASERGRRTRRVSGHSSASTSALAARASSAFSGHQSYPQQPGLMYGAPQQGVMEMPLLPPSAPFMMQSYGGGRRGSMSSAGGSSAHSNSNSRSGSASPARSAGSSASGSRVSLVGGGSDRVQRASARPASHRRQSSGGSLGGSPGMPYMLPRSGSMPNQWGVQPQQQQQMMMPMYGMAAPVYGMYGSPMMQQQQVPMQVPYAMAGQYAQRSMPIAGRQSIIF